MTSRFADRFSALVLAGAVIPAAALGGTPANAAPKAVYAARCSMCHQANAEGLAGQFPRLAGRTAAIGQSPEGRHYLARIVLYGMYGSITVDGQPITGLMPSMAVMSDAEVADALNHVIRLKAVRPAVAFKPAEIAAVRAEGKVGGNQNAELRQQLVAAGAIK